MSDVFVFASIVSGVFSAFVFEPTLLCVSEGICPSLGLRIGRTGLFSAPGCAGSQSLFINKILRWPQKGRLMHVFCLHSFVVMVYESLGRILSRNSSGICLDIRYFSNSISVPVKLFF